VSAPAGLISAACSRRRPLHRRTWPQRKRPNLASTGPDRDLDITESPPIYCPKLELYPLERGPQLSCNIFGRQNHSRRRILPSINLPALRPSQSTQSTLYIALQRIPNSERRVLAAGTFCMVCTRVIPSHVENKAQVSPPCATCLLQISTAALATGKQNRA
jgi:hypothetical protein